MKLDADCADEVFVRRVNLEAQNAREKLEADEFDDTWNRVSAGTFVMNIQREWRHCGRKRHDRDRDAVVQAWHERMRKTVRWCMQENQIDRQRLESK